MRRSRAQLVVDASCGAPRVTTTSAAAPQRWAGVRHDAGGWVEAIHQVVGDGVFAGDWHATSITVSGGARLVVRGITATPLRRGGAAGTVTRIRATAGATLLHLPGPLLPQTGSDHTTAVHIDAEAGAQVLVASIVVPGRAGMGERGLFQRLRLRTQAVVGGTLAFAEDAVLEPATAGIDGPAIFDGDGAALSVLTLGAWDAATPDWWAGLDLPGLTGGATRLRSGGVCYRARCRTLGDALAAIAWIEARVRAGACGVHDCNQ